MTYEPLPVACDLCVVALEECARRLGPAFVYTLTVPPDSAAWVRSLLKQMLADVKGNPFSPYVNLEIDEKLTPFEWYLGDGKRAVGSRGCT